MAQCAYCPSLGADPDWGICFECFCASNPVYPEPQYPSPTDEDYCGPDHLEYEPYGQCYCGAVKYVDGKKVEVAEQIDQSKGV